MRYKKAFSSNGIKCSFNDINLWNEYVREYRKWKSENIVENIESVWIMENNTTKTFEEIKRKFFALSEILLASQYIFMPVPNDRVYNPEKHNIYGKVFISTKIVNGIDTMLSEQNPIGKTFEFIDVRGSVIHLTITDYVRENATDEELKDKYGTDYKLHQLDYGEYVGEGYITDYTVVDERARTKFSICTINRPNIYLKYKVSEENEEAFLTAEKWKEYFVYSDAAAKLIQKDYNKLMVDLITKLLGNNFAEEYKQIMKLVDK